MSLVLGCCKRRPGLCGYPAVCVQLSCCGSFGNGPHDRCFPVPTSLCRFFPQQTRHWLWQQEASRCEKIRHPKLVNESDCSVPLVYWGPLIEGCHLACGPQIAPWEGPVSSSKDHLLRDSTSFPGMQMNIWEADPGAPADILMKSQERLQSQPPCSCQAKLLPHFWPIKTMNTVFLAC